MTDQNTAAQSRQAFQGSTAGDAGRPSRAHDFGCGVGIPYSPAPSTAKDLHLRLQHAQRQFAMNAYQVLQDPRDKQIVDLQWECAMLTKERDAACLERDAAKDFNASLLKIIGIQEAKLAALGGEIERDRALQQKQSREAERMQRAPCEGFGTWVDPAPVAFAPAPHASGKPLPAQALFCQTQAIGLVVR